MKILKKILATVLTGGWPCPVAAKGLPGIERAVVENPPWYPGGRGPADLTIDHITKRLPQFRHRKVTVTLARREALARQGKDTCFLMAYKTPERKNRPLFSRPSNLISGPLTPCAGMIPASAAAASFRIPPCAPGPSAKETGMVFTGSTGYHARGARHHAAGSP